jgi:cobalamin biosynthesis protein CbiD
MDDDELHELRMTIGQNSMDIADAMDEDIIRAIAEAKEAVTTMITLLDDKGLQKQFIAGIMAAALMDVAKLNEGEGPES